MIVVCVSSALSQLKKRPVNKCIKVETAKNKQIPPMDFERMQIFLQILVLLLAVEIIFGTDPPQRSVLFPDLSAENSEEFDYGDINLSSKQSPAKIEKVNFRIDSTDVPCVNTTMRFCEEVTNQAYPKQYVESILAKIDAQTYKNFFNKTLSNDTLGLRLLSTDDSIEVCDSYKYIIHPKLALNVQRKWHYVINQPSYQQPILVEICRKKKSECLFSENSSDYVSTCVQKYTKVPLLSLDENGQIVSYTYEFPTYCQCKIQSKKHEKFTKRQQRY